MQRPKIVDLLGFEVVKGIQELGLGKDNIELAKILCEVKGSNMFSVSDIIKCIIYPFDENDLSAFNKYYKNISNIINYDQYREKLLKEKWGNNDFSRALLQFFNLNEEDYLNKPKYIPVHQETIIPRLSPNEKLFEGQKIVIPEMYPLHLYQKKVKDQLIKEIIKPSTKLLVHMPTGAGKTKTAIEALCEFWRVYAHNDGFMIWITERSELCEQAYETMKDTWRAKGDFPINCQRNH